MNGFESYLFNNIKRRISGALLAAVLPAGLLLGCAVEDKKMYTSQLFAMDTIMELQISGHEDALPGAEEIIRSLEKELSVTDKESAIYRLNATGDAEFSEKAADMIKRALRLCNRTEGALDISIYPVLKAWGFTTGNYRIPEEEEINKLLENVGYESIEVSESKDGALVRIPEGMDIDLGSVTKGYAGSAVADYFMEDGVTSAIINLGGNVQCIGKKPDGSRWKVAVKSPFQDSSTGMFAVIEAEDEAIITSGGYERYFEENGEIYWHILDPKDGHPARNGLASVTVIGKDGLLCDALSTALFVMGLDGALEFWRASDDFEAVFITEEGEAYVTEGIADSFTLSGEYYDAPLTVISR
jgi:thiamine biosynthesis lipoprotein